MTITAGYDSLSRLLSLSGTADANGIGAVTRSYSYDAFDNITAANDNLDGAAGAELAFTYDSENRVATSTTSNLFGTDELNNTHSYLYGAHDMRRELSDSFAGTTAYLYDPVDRLTLLTTPQGDAFETSYDLAGRTLGRVAPNVTDMLRQYDVATGRLARQTQRTAGTAFNAFDYDYTPRGNISAIEEGGEVVRTKAYSYDAIERLTEVSVPSAPAQEEAYTLDPEGNRITSHLSATHETDEANRLTSDDSYTYVYDLNGNLISKLPKASAPAGTPEWGTER